MRPRPEIRVRPLPLPLAFFSIASEAAVASPLLLTERSRGKSWVEVISKIGRFDDVVIVDDVFGGANFCEKII